MNYLQNFDTYSINEGSKLKFLEFYQNNKEKVTEGVKLFFQNIKNHSKDTALASKHLKKLKNGEKLNKQELDDIKKQFIDNLKLVGVVIPSIFLPGGSIVLYLLIKLSSKFNFEILPTNFQKKLPKEVDKITEGLLNDNFNDFFII